jgi:hypothetical protein
MKRTQWMLVLIGFMAVSFPASAGNVLFVLSPSDGVLGGQAGTAVGWGYTITNSGTDYVTIESFVFGDLTPVGIFSTPGVPSTAATNGTPITSGPWVEGLSGLQYDISALALLGASTQGVMTLIYDTYSDAELTNQTDGGLTVNAQVNPDRPGDVLAQVNVNADAARSDNVPEPGSLGLIGMGCARRWRCGGDG